MPVYLKPNELFVKNPNGEGYLPQNVIAEAPASEILVAFDEAISGANAALSQAQAAANNIESQKDTMIASIASIAGQGTDTTLTQTGVAADAAACGDLKSAMCGIIKADGSPAWTAGVYYQTGSTITSADVNNPGGTNANYACTYFSCDEGDIFLLTSVGGSGSRCYAFLSNASGENNILLRATSADSQAGFSNDRIVAPSSAKYAIFNADVRHPYYVYKLNPTLDYIEGCMTEQGQGWT